MNKTVIMFLSLCISAYAVSYKSFKNHTLKHAKTLQSQALTVQMTQLENNIALRTPNPTLGLEVGRYDAKGRDNDYGYSILASQKVRTSGYLDALGSQSIAKSALSKAYAYDSKSQYLKNMEETYTQYVYQSKLLGLLQEEYRLAKKMTHIAKERYINGSETKVAYLQAKTQAMTLKTKMSSTKQTKDTLYYKLLAIGGYSKKIKLSKTFIYGVKSRGKKYAKANSQQKILQAKERLLQTQLQIQQHTFSSYDISAGIEKEPDQSILRLGVSLPLPLRHNKEEEKTLARLKLAQLKLDSGQLSLNLKSQKQSIKTSLSELHLQYQALRALKKEQQSLANLLREGYEIAQGSLFEMMLAKNKLIQTKKSLLQTQMQINLQHIALRLLQGAYHD